MKKRVRIFRRSIPLWLIGVLLVASGAGAAAGTILGGRVTGEIPVTISQALLVGEPSFPNGLPPGVTRQTIRIVPHSPDRAIGIVGDDTASFRAAAEIDTGDVFLIKVPLKNASDQDMYVEMSLTVPEGLEVEAFASDEESLSAVDNTRHMTRIGPNKWVFQLSHEAEFYTADWRDSIGIVIGADDWLMPGFYTIQATLQQITGKHANVPALYIAKVGPAEIALNGRADYTISITNSGDGTASQVVVEDIIPTGMSYASSSPAATVTGSLARWDVGTLAPGETRTFYLSLNATQVGEWTNRATINCAENATDSAHAVTRVVFPSIDVSKTGPPQSGLGASASYSITVRNTGEVLLTNVLLTDQIPTGMSYISSSPVGAVSGKQVSWSLGTLTPGQSREISLVLRGDTIGSWTDTATVTTTEGVSDSASATTVVVAQASGMTMSSTDTQDPISVNDQTTYVITVTNQGLVALHNVRIVDTIPDNMNYVSATGPAAHSVSGRTVTFSPVSSIAPSETLTYRVTVVAVSAGSAVNTAVLTYDEFTTPRTVQEGTTITSLP